MKVSFGIKLLVISFIIPAFAFIFLLVFSAIQQFEIENAPKTHFAKNFSDNIKNSIDQSILDKSKEFIPFSNPYLFKLPLESQHKEYYQRMLHHWLLSNETIHFIQLCQPNGQVMAYSQKGNKKNTIIESKNYLHQEWFHAALVSKPGGAIYISDIEIDEQLSEDGIDERRGINFAFPVFSSDSSILGVMRVRCSDAIFLEKNYDLFKSVLESNYANANVFVFNKQGRMLFSNQLKEDKNFTIGKSNLGKQIDINIGKTTLNAESNIYGWTEKNIDAHLYVLTVIPSVSIFDIQFLLQSDWYTILVVTLSVILLLFILFILLNRSVQNTLKYVTNSIATLSSGNTISKEKVIKSGDEFQTMANSLHVLNRRFEELTLYMFEIGKGNYSITLSGNNEQDKLGNALITLKNEIEFNQIQVQSNLSVNKNLNDLSKILTKFTSPEEIHSEMLSFLIKVTKSQVGLTYIRSSENAFDLIHTWGISKEQCPISRFEMYETLLGAALGEGHLKDYAIPTDVGVAIESGLGNSTSNHTILFPLIYGNDKMGIIELVSMYSFEKNSIEFLKQASSLIAVWLIGIEKGTLMNNSYEL